MPVETDYAPPGKPGYVVRYDDSPRVLSTMRWGFPTRKPRKRPGREGKLPFLFDWWTNARNMQGTMWRTWLARAEHRCLVPFTRFAEPKATADRREPGDTNWWFTVEDQQLPCFVGLWKADQDHDRVYAFCTTEPNPLVAPRHPKAMPVILMAADHERWLTAPVDHVVDLLAPYPSQLMAMYRAYRRSIADDHRRIASTSTLEVKNPPPDRRNTHRRKRRLPDFRKGLVMDRLPMPLRSRLALGEAAIKPAGLPLTAGGSTYTMAQEAVFIDTNHYAVGRWDGTLSLFAFTDSTTQGPLIAKAVNSPAQEGIQMIVTLDAGVFASSNDDASVLVWSSSSGNWTDLTLATTLAFPEALGVANSGAVATSNGMPTFVVGHANGYVTIWRRGGTSTQWTLAQTVDVRAATPVNPWGLHNVRGVVPLALGDGAGYVATGSEDGNLTVVRVSDGTIMSATVYNPAAQRGINSVAVEGNLLLVANCAVGPTDSNLWCYTVDQSNWNITNTAKAALKVDPQAAQVFNFDVIFSALDCGPMRFFCSTEEGALWMGEVQPGGTLSILGYQKVGTYALGSALCSSGTRLAVTAYDLHEYMIGA